VKADIVAAVVAVVARDGVEVEVKLVVAAGVHIDHMLAGHMWRVTVEDCFRVVVREH
jgi:hypothetical protein